MESYVYINLIIFFCKLNLNLALACNANFFCCFFFGCLKAFIFKYFKQVSCSFFVLFKNKNFHNGNVLN